MPKKETAKLSKTPWTRCGWSSGATDGLGLSAREKQSLAAADLIGPTSKYLAKLVQGGATYRFLRIRQVDGRPRALFRLLAPGGLNYHDLCLVVDTHGNVRIEDMELYMTGEPLSQNLRTFMGPFLDEHRRGVLAKLLGLQNEFIKLLPQIELMGQALSTGRHKEAYAIYQKLPPSVQKHQAVMLMGLQASLPVDPEVHINLLEAYVKEFPDAKNSELIILDVLLLRGKYDESLRAIDRLDQKVGGDPYLHSVRGLVHKAKKDLPAARRAFEACREAEPTLPQSYWNYIDLEMETGNFAKVAELLTAVQEKAKVVLKDITEIPFYTPFVNSPEGKAWLQKKRR